MRWVAAALLGASSAAAAEPGTGSEDEQAGGEEHEQESFGNALLLRVAYIESLRSASGAEGVTEGEAAGTAEEGEGPEALMAHHLGVGLAYERTLVHGWLNAQLSGLAFATAEGWELPAGLLLEMPWEWTDQIEAYLGAGLAVDVLRESKLSPHLGVAASTGIFAWASERLGVNVDVEYRWLPNEQLVYDLTIGAAAAVRF